MRLILTLILVLLIGCASIVPADKDDREAVLPYQKRFVEMSQGQFTLKQVQSIPIYIKPHRVYDLETKTWQLRYTRSVGVCYPLGFFSFIVINERYWEAMDSDFEKEEIIFHELGHCILMKSHTVPTDVDGISSWWEGVLFKTGIFKERQQYLKDECPSSYMNPNALNEDCIKKHHEYYMDELFNRTTREIYEDGH